MSKNNVITFCIFLISPLLALPFILRLIYERQKGHIFLLSLFMGIIAYLTAPCGDLARHSLMYFKFMDMSYPEFWNSLRVDFLVQIISFWLGKIGIPYDFLRFVLLFCYTSIIMRILDDQVDISKEIYTRKEYWTRFLIMFFFANFLNVIIGVRYGFAVALLAYAIHSWINLKKKTRAIVVIILSICIHFSMLYFLCFIILFSFHKFRKMEYFSILIICILISSGLIAFIGQYFLGNEIEGAVYFGSGAQGTGFNYTISNLIFRYIRFIMTLPIIILAYNKSKYGKSFSSIILGLFLLYIATYSWSTISGRVLIIIQLFGIILLLSVENKWHKLSLLCTRTFLMCSLILTLSLCYAWRDIIGKSRYEQIVYPVPFIFSQHYNEKWVTNELMEEYGVNEL